MTVLVATLDASGRGVCLERVPTLFARRYAETLAASLPADWRVELHPPGPRLARAPTAALAGGGAPAKASPSGLLLVVVDGRKRPTEVRPRKTPEGAKLWARRLAPSLAPGGEVVLYRGHETLFWAVCEADGRVVEKIS